jgi:hypothetical protein
MRFGTWWKEKQNIVFGMPKIEILPSSSHTITLLVERTRHAVCWKAQHYVSDCVESNALGNVSEGRVEKVVRGSID